MLAQIQANLLQHRQTYNCNKSNIIQYCNETDHSTCEVVANYISYSFVIVDVNTLQQTAGSC